MLRKTLIITTALSGLILTGCATNIPGSNTYRAQESGIQQSIEYGIIESIKYVTLDKGTTGVGLGTGAVLGGIAGGHLGGGWGSVALGVGGAVLGGMAGQAIEKQTSKTDGVELTIRLNSGRVTSIVQPNDEQFSVGNRVKLVNNGQRTRVSKY